MMEASAVEDQTPPPGLQRLWARRGTLTAPPPVEEEFLEDLFPPAQVRFQITPMGNVFGGMYLIPLSSNPGYCMLKQKTIKGLLNLYRPVAKRDSENFQKILPVSREKIIK